MYAYEQIREVHLEVTDKCNAACPQCARNDSGGETNPRLPLVDLSLEDVKNIFPVDFLSRLDRIFACGNYGDPIMAKDTLGIFRYFRRWSDTVRLGMHSNGGARNAEWWSELATIISKEGGYVVFGIDGLEDTNHIYRRHTQWSVIMRNVKAFIGAGGNALWDFLVFRHNEHQVEKARQLAKDMGFSRFNVKKTKRFIDFGKIENRDRTPIKNSGGDTVGWLEMPINPEWRNENLGQFSWQSAVKLGDIKDNYDSLSEYLDTVKINCKVKADKSIYVTAEGYVLPCCWLGTHLYDNKMKDGQRQILPLLESMGGVEVINAKKIPIKEIVEGPFFQNHIPDSWDKKSFVEGKNHTCARICGVKHGLTA